MEKKTNTKRRALDSANNDFYFPLFKSYSEFILQNHLSELVEDIIKKSKEGDLPFIQLLSQYSEQEVFQIFQNWLEEQIFIPLLQGQPYEQLERKLIAWKESKGIFSVDQLRMSDIFSISNIKKKGLLNFLKHYDCSDEIRFKLIDEIDIYFEKTIELAINAYEEIQNNKNVSKKVSNEQKETLILQHQETEDEYSSLIDGVKDYAIFKLNPDGTVASWNEGAYTLKGYTKQEILGKHFSIFYPKEKQDSHFPQYELEEARKKGRFEDEGFRVKKDGSQIWANVVITPIYDKQNILRGYTKITRDVTERWKAEEKLRQSEERMRAMISGVKDYAIFLLNPDGTVASWNEGAKKFKGYNENEILGKHFSIFYPAEKQQSKFPDYELEQAKRIGRFEDEGLRVRKDGTTFWANVVITAVYTDKNELLGFTKVTRDLTERRNAEQILRQSEERFRLLVEGVRDYAIYMLNPDGTVASWNEGARTFKGYTKEEIMGRHFSVFYPEDKRNEGYPDFELQVARKSGRFEDEGFRIRKDGSRFWANVIITAIYNDRKELLGFTKITRDLTERRQAEEILRRSEERYRLLIDAVKDYAIFMVDPEGRINSWNEGARRLNGYTESEILGKHISIFYTEDQKKENYMDYELEQARNFGRFEDEGFRMRKDGSTFYANVIITALFDKDKSLIGYSKITRDLTERKALEEGLQNVNIELEEKVTQRTEELSKTVKELTKINNDLDNFIYTASHDLKAPVSNIEGLITGLFDELGSEAQTNVNLSTIRELLHSSIQRFQTTIKELTEIAKIQKGSFENSESIDLNEIVNDVKLTLKNMIVKNEAEIITDFRLKSSIPFVKKNIDSIFYNLLSNAIKYRSPDRNPVIEISSEVKDDYVILTFIDNGLGFKAENKRKMFTMFKRFHDHVEGTGIGLYIVKRIVENAGGEIEVESDEAKGTTFKVYLPQTPL